MRRAYLEGLEHDELLSYDSGPGQGGIQLAGRTVDASQSPVDVDAMITDLEAERAKRKGGGG